MHLLLRLLLGPCSRDRIQLGVDILREIRQEELQPRPPERLPTSLLFCHMFLPYLPDLIAPGLFHYLLQRALQRCLVLRASHIAYQFLGLGIGAIYTESGLARSSYNVGGVIYGLDFGVGGADVSMDGVVRAQVRRFI